MWLSTGIAAADDVTDTTVADFGAGTPDNTYVSETDDGEVILQPAVGEEFSGASLPSGFTSGTWDPAGTTTVSGGQLTVDGAFAGTTDSFSAGRSLEFVATFGGANFQHVGFAVDLNEDPHWAIFSIKNDGTFNARTNNGGTPATTQETPLDSGLVGAPHRYRIEWTATTVTYFIDGGLVATHNAFGDFGATVMRPLASDLTAGGPNVSVDWLHMSDYSASGDFESRVFDGGTNATWQTLDWSADVPAGTDVAMSIRTGDTPTPDGTWTDFESIAGAGDPIVAPRSRYLQYRADLSTDGPLQTPTLNDVTVTFVQDSPPVAVDDAASVGEDDPPTAINVLANDTDADGGPKTIESVTQPDNGTVAVTGGGTGLTYEPDPGYCNDPGGSPDEFTYALDPGGDSATVAVTVTCGESTRPSPGPSPGPSGGAGIASLDDDAVKVKKHIPLEIACAAGESCEGTVEVETAKPVSIAGAVAAKKKVVRLARETPFSIPAGQTETVRAKLTRKAKKLLKLKPKVKAEVAITTVGAGGPLTTTESLTVKKKKK